MPPPCLQRRVQAASDLGLDVLVAHADVGLKELVLADKKAGHRVVIIGVCQRGLLGFLDARQRDLPIGGVLGKELIQSLPGLQAVAAVNPFLRQLCRLKNTLRRAKRALMPTKTGLSPLR